MQIKDTIFIDERELEERFIKASGPGGQNVNKVSTAVELRFDVRQTTALTASVRARLERLAGHRMTDDGILLVKADRFRTQDRNREDARDRLRELILAALVEPKRRIKTRPTLAAKRRRMETKAKRSTVKKLRQTRTSDD